MLPILFITTIGAFMMPGFPTVRLLDPFRVANSYGLFAVVWWVVALRPRINPALRSYWSAFYIRLDLHFPRDVGVGLWRVAHGLSWAPASLDDRDI